MGHRQFSVGNSKMAIDNNNTATSRESEKSDLNNNNHNSSPPPDNDSDDESEIFHDARFPADDETRLLEESHTIKAEANQLFISSCYDQAISCYDRALASCPNYLDYEVAVLKSNVAACYLKLEDWKAAVDSATASMERLDKIVPPTSASQQFAGSSGSRSGSGSGKASNDSKEKAKDNNNKDEDTDAVVELSGDSNEAEELERVRETDKRKNDVLRIRAKALMRRARAKTQLGGWSGLQGAEEDYKTLAAMNSLPPEDRRIVQKALRELPGRINEARDKEMADMKDKLKELGNGILKPFGLSTDNFNFVQDPNTGGYSMNFQS